MRLIVRLTVRFTVCLIARFTVRFTVHFTVRFTVRFTVHFTVRFTVPFTVHHIVRLIVGLIYILPFSAPYSAPYSALYSAPYSAPYIIALHALYNLRLYCSSSSLLTKAPSPSDDTISSTTVDRPAYLPVQTWRLRQSGAGSGDLEGAAGGARGVEPQDGARYRDDWSRSQSH